MSRLGITYEQVELAAEKILLDGFNPTIEKVRQVLGGTGSNSTIAKYLNDWKSLRLKASCGNDLSMTQHAPDPVNAAVNRVWQQIREETSKEVSTLREKFNAELKAAQTELQLTIQDNEKLRAENTLFQENIYHITAEKELLLLQEKELQHEIKRLTDRNQAQDEKHSLLYQQMQAQLNDIKSIQSRELEQQASLYETLKDQHEKRIKDIRIDQEKEHHAQLNLIDELKTESHKQLKLISQLTNELHDREVKFSEKTTELTAIREERDHLTKKMILDCNQQEKLNHLLERVQSFERHHEQSALQIQTILSSHESHREKVDHTLQHILERLQALSENHLRKKK